MVQFDDGNTLSESAQFYAERVFTDADSANAYYQEVSNNSLRLVGVDDPNGDVLGPVTVHFDPNVSCSDEKTIRSWAEQAHAALTQPVVDQYQHIVYLLPSSAGCPFAGVAEIDGDQSWIQEKSVSDDIASYTSSTVAHELGHNFGLNHSDTYVCTSPNNTSTYKPVFPGTTCSLTGKSDPFDIMSPIALSEHHIHALSKHRLGFIPAANTLTWDADGVYTLHHAEHAVVGTQLIKIPAAAPSTSFDYYFLELRRPFGTFFDNFTPADPAVNGVLVRRGSDVPFANSGLIDTTPETGGSAFGSASAFDDAALATGRSLTLPDARARISVLGISDGVATVRIERANDSEPPTISAVSFSAESPYVVNITWTTSEAAYAQLEYGATADYGNTQEYLATTGTITRRLSSLTQNTAYHFRIRAVDEFGNVGESDDLTWTTPADVVPPTITTPTAAPIAASSAQIHWRTNESTTCNVQYGTTTSYGATASRSGIIQSLFITGLLESTTYHFRVVCSDPAGNSVISPDQAFTTLDGGPPTITDLRAVNVSTTVANMYWRTNEPATCDFEYGASTSYGSRLTRTGSLFGLLVPGLQNATTYYYRVTCRDAVGGTTVSPGQSFTTLDAPPTIIDLRAVNVSTTLANMYWRTNEPATCDFEYGTSTSYGSRLTRTGSLFGLLVPGLQNATTYHYRVTCRDSAGNATVSPSQTFNTL